MKIFITGTAGFIGFHLAKSLLDEGHEVVGYDNFNDYYSVELKEARNRIIQKHPAFKCLRADLCDKEALNRVFSENNFDVVCNLAAQAGVRYSLTHPHVYQQSNIEGFLNILEACRHSHSETPRLVYASSSSVYGGNTKLPFSVADRVDSPISLYAASKKCNELMAHCYSHLYGMQTVGLRFFTVYGPWGRPDMAMWLFTEAILKNKPINVFNNGNMQRDFTYIDDIIAGVKAAMFSDELEKYELFNLGNHRSEKLMDMISILSKTLGREPVINMLPMQPGDVPATYADISDAQRKLGFKPETPISDGIPRFVKWYKEYKS